MLALVATNLRTCSVSGPQKLRSALSLAAGLRDAATAGLLLDHGADLEVQDSVRFADGARRRSTSCPGYVGFAGRSEATGHLSRLSWFLLVRSRCLRSMDKLL